MVCHRDGNPLISTLIFSQAEWFCMECRNAYGLMNVDREPWTEELQQKLDEQKAEFEELRKDCIPHGSYRRDCDQCMCRGEFNNKPRTPHIEHASAEAKQASKVAYSKLYGDG